ncbi:MAG: glycoside hydrolase family 95 protein, partial [Defluviitaleaceae bacterium]|nr:glycoside hydrolase family 95 protein [Defluviitaleaceae bacterium]
MHSLWYTEEARVWEEALPLGNGRMGAMVFSGIAEEKLSLNDDTLWAGHPQRHTRQGAEAKYKEARSLAMAGKYKEAQEIIEEFLLGEHSQRYLPMGDLLLEMDAPTAEVAEYRRELDLETAIHTLAYKLADGTTYQREAFMAHKPEPVFVMRLTGSKPFNITAKFTCQLHHTTTATGHELILDGIALGLDEPPDNGQDLA